MTLDTVPDAPPAPSREAAAVPGPTVRGGRHRFSLRRQVGRAFLAFFTAVAVLMAAVIASAVLLIDRGHEVIARWQPAVARSESLLADAVNQETGVRGYALSGNQELLTPYSQYVARQRSDERRLRRLIGNHREAGAALDAFDAALRTWRSSVAGKIISDVRAHAPRAAGEAEGARGKRRFDRVRARGATLTAELRRIQIDAIGARRTAALLLWVALGLFVAVVLAAGVLLWRGLRTAVLDPVEELAMQTRAVAAGDTHLEIVPSGPPELAALGADVDRMRAQIAAELVRAEAASREAHARSEELARSNADLEQFAYVASHDLSEPLRKVANFCQLLERQYAAQLDDKARQYICFAVDGAKRMQVLIGDLLAFSRVGRTSDSFAEVNADAPLARALANLEDRIAGTNAEIVVGDLPMVRGDCSLLTALFQNLVGNALKYRSDDRPRVEITADLADGQWRFTLSDNGIGIDPQYAERIFAIFQRLHLRDQYGGTGIGLALCRRIVEFHGGRIWLQTDHVPRQGATFCFTLPVPAGTAVVGAPARTDPARPE